MIEYCKIIKKSICCLKKHYFIFIIVCLIALILNSEFFGMNSISFVEKKFMPVSSQNITHFITNTRNNLRNATYKVNKNDGSTLDKKLIIKKIYENKRGIIATIIKNIDNCNLYSKNLSFFKTKNIFSKYAIVFSIISNFLLLGIYYIFIVCLYKIMIRRVFLEARIYKKVPFKDLFFLVRVKKNLKVIKSMMFVSLCKLLWNLTIIGGFIKRYSYYLVPYIIAENPNIDGKSAIKISSALMNGHKMECFLFELSFIPWYILSFITFNISSILFSNPYKISFFTEYYVYLRNNCKDVDSIKLLIDKYLYEKADSKLLKNTYKYSIINQESKEYRNSMLEEIFGINISDKKSREYKENERINSYIKKQTDDEVRGDSYPNRLYIIKEKRWFKPINYLRNYNIESLFFIFYIVSFGGWLWEVILHYLEFGEFVNRGVMHGPWLPIYGFGVVAILVLLNKLRDRKLILFLTIMLMCGIMEYFASFYLEIIHGGERWWDYSGYLFNLNGRICLEGLIVFAIGGAIAVYLLAPMLDAFVKKVNRTLLLVILTFISIFFIIDFAYSTKFPNKGEGITDDRNFVSKINRNIVDR